MCCSFSSSVSLVIRDSVHHCHLHCNMQLKVHRVLIALATALTSRCSARLSTSLRSAQSITRPMFLILNPCLASSTTCNLRLLRNQIVVAQLACVFLRRASLAEVLAAASPVVRSGSVWSSLGNGRRTQQRLPHSIARIRSRIKETRHLQHSARPYHALSPHCSQPSPKNVYYSKEITVGEGATKSNHPSDVLLLYYDDVSCGPRPRAHWYMLIHRCCSDTAPYWTPHHVA